MKRSTELMIEGLTFQYMEDIFKDYDMITNKQGTNQTQNRRLNLMAQFVQKILQDPLIIFNMQLSSKRKRLCIDRCMEILRHFPQLANKEVKPIQVE